MNFIKKYKTSFLLGFLAGFSFPPFYLVFFLPISFYYLINKVIKSNSYKESFLYGFIFGFGYYLIQLYWISFSLFTDIKKYFWLFPFAISLIPLICALYIGFSILLFKFILNKFKITNNFFITIIFALSYIIFEYIKGLIFPWNLFSYILGFSDILIQPVYIINIYIYDFILILFFCFSFVLFKLENKKIFLINKKYISIYIIILMSILFFGFFRLNNKTEIKLDKNVRLVQANIKQSLKWNKEELNNNLKKHIDLSLKNSIENIDIIIWAESSFPFLLEKDSILSDKFSVFSDKTLITGSIRGEFKKNELQSLWNSIFFIKNKEVVEFYDKTVLVPFGEYIPFSKYIPFVKKITNGSIEFSKGKNNKTININNIKISPVICYEIIFKNNVIDKNNKPDIIINLTNDGWFGFSSGPYQHLVATKFRAVENNLPIIRVSNSGITAYINNYGEIIKKIKLNKTETLDLKI